MERHRLSDYKKGWFVWDFDPVIIKTGDFEVSIKHYDAGAVEMPHYHAIATEITAITSWRFVMNGENLGKDDIIVLSPGEVANFQCLESGTTVVVKMPSIPEDKYLV